MDLHQGSILGATIFYSYILLAFLLTGSIINSLLRSYPSVQRHTVNKKGLLLRCSLAFLSFAVLSYHMLLFLIDSYKAWSLRQNIPLPGLNPLRPESWKDFHPWIWATESSLFIDFAMAAFEKKETAVWTFIALCWELYQAQYMTGFCMCFVLFFYNKYNCLYCSYNAQNLLRFP
jgi:hypothetical protein